MGDPVKIVDLAHDLIRLSGLEPNEDILVQFTGLRPGEKLFEELSFQEEHVDKTRHPKIYIGRLTPHDGHLVRTCIERLDSLVTSEGDEDDLRGVLRDLVPEYTTSGNVRQCADRNSPIHAP
jgi:FlaA1/EpsC-like NDP-sugar epimerase